MFLFSWIPILGVDASLLWDPLAATMTLVVTGVGALIHIYAIGYMHGDDRFPRFFAYMNLFIASMLTFVLADNFAVMFVGWELVGLSSYLLISFWFTKPAAAAAGKKAFIVNRIGDWGFLVALMLIFAAFGTFDFATVFEEAPTVLTVGMATAITLLLFVGATGKSAQIPLVRVAPRRDGGPYPGLRPHPRRDHGHGRCLHDRPHRRAVPTGTDHRRRRRDRRCRNGVVRGHAGGGPARHQDACSPTPRSASWGT